MQVNTNVYGLPETWLHVMPLSGYNEDNKNLVPAWQTIGGGITAGKIDFDNPLDNSIAYAALAADSPIAEINTVVANDTDNPLQTIPDATPIFPALLNVESYGKFTQTYYDLTNNKDIQIYSPNETLDERNLNKYIQPMCSISPKDVVLKIVVRAYKSDWSEYKTFKYNEYLSGDDMHPYTYTVEYPHIYHVYALPYARIENSENRTRQYIDMDNVGGFYIARDCEFDCPTWGTIRDYALTNLKGGLFNGVHVWGISDVNGAPYWGETPNYVYKCIGAGGTLKKINSSIIMYRDYDATGDFVHRAVASFGLFFCDDDDTAENGAYNSNKMMLGTIDEQGLTHGDYTYGTDNETQPQYDWTSTNDSKYNPDAPIDKNTYSAQTTFNTVGNYNGMVNRYVLDGTAVRALSTSLWAVMGDLITDAGGDYANLEGVDYENFLTANPMDCIIDLRKYPFKDIPAKGHWSAATQKNINFGKKASSAAGYEFNYTMFEYAFTNVDIFPRFGNCFLDYAPYTTMELYVPFCGTVELNPADFMGHTLKVKMEIDYTTGSCVTYICADNLVVKSVNGTVAIDIPVTGTNSARIMSNLNNAVVSEGASRAALEKAKVKNYFTLKGAVAGSMDLYTGGQFGVTGKLNKAMTAGERWTQKGAEYNLTHQEQPVNVIKSCSSAGGWAIDLQCRLIIYYPDADFITWTNNKPSLNLDALATYAHLNGFACLENKRLNNFTGYTVVSEIDLSNCAASETEKQLIRGLLQSGVYI